MQKKFFADAQNDLGKTMQISAGDDYMFSSEQVGKDLALFSMELQHHSIAQQNVILNEVKDLRPVRNAEEILRPRLV